MRCVSFPRIFKGNSTLIIDDNPENNSKDKFKATSLCLRLFLNSEQGELFGDPDFGIRIKKYMFNQNNYVLRDILIDEIYTKVQLFFNQITINRKDINIKQSGTQLIAEIPYRIKNSFELNTFELVLFKGENDL